MRWTLFSVLFAILLSVIGWIVSSFPFDIVAKVVFWNLVLFYLTVEVTHLIHMARERAGG